MRQYVGVHAVARMKLEVGQNVAVEQYKGFFAQHWQRPYYATAGFSSSDFGYSE